MERSYHVEAVRWMDKEALCIGVSGRARLISLHPHGESKLLPETPKESIPPAPSDVVLALKEK